MTQIPGAPQEPAGPTLPPPPGYPQPPAYAQPEYAQPGFPQPPAYAQPEYAQPGFPQPPTYAQPEYAQPGFPQPPTYARPEYAQPGFPQPPTYAQPGFPQPPTYAQPGFPQPPAYAMQAPLQYGPAGDSRNVLGILALVAPFVGFSMLGIVLGHLGLSAVKKGLANNRGIALAGTIVSWVFTVFATLGIVAAVVLPVILTQRQAAHEAGVKSDLRTIAISIETYYVDNGHTPTLSFDGRNYHVGDDVIPAESSVTDARMFSPDGQSYCVEVDYVSGLTRSIETGGYLGDGC